VAVKKPAAQRHSALCRRGTVLLRAVKRRNGKEGKTGKGGAQLRRGEGLL